MKKKYLLAVPLLAGLAAISAYAVSPASASVGMHDSLVKKLAEKFNVSETDVETIFEEHRTEQQAERKQEIEANLNKALSDGVITEDQKNLLIAKQEERRAEMEANREERQNSQERPSAEDREARREKMETEREEFEKWAEEQGIDLDKLKEYGVMGMGGSGGHGGPGGPGRP